MKLIDIKRNIDEGLFGAIEVFELMASHADYMSDLQYRAGFMAGWNSGLSGNESTLNIVSNRVGNREDYFPEENNE